MLAVLKTIRKKLYKFKIPLHKLSLGSCYNNKTQLDEFILRKKEFPTAYEYTTQLGCSRWFRTINKEINYNWSRLKQTLPCFSIDVVDVREEKQLEDVYDIVDMKNQTFFANGIVVHNCTTYMGRKNITRVAEELTNNYKGKLVYGDTDCCGWVYTSLII